MICEIDEESEFYDLISKNWFVSIILSQTKFRIMVVLLDEHTSGCRLSPAQKDMERAAMAAPTVATVERAPVTITASLSTVSVLAALWEIAC